MTGTKTATISTVIAACLIGAGIAFVRVDPAAVDEEAIRACPEVRQAMDAYRAAVPWCEWCGRSNGVALAVHHELPIWLAPDRAADSNNFVVLCREDHLRVGHAGNYKDCVVNVRELCGARRIARRGK